MKLFNKIFAVCLTLSVLGGTLLPSPWTCGGFTEPVPIKVNAEGEPTTIDSGIGVLITMLLANGIRFVGNFDDTVKPGIEKLWNDFTTATGNTVTLATLGAQSVVQLGYLRTSSAVNNAVNAFQNWFVSDYSVPVSGDVSIPISSGANFLTGDANTCAQYMRGSDGYNGFFTCTKNYRYANFKIDGSNAVQTWFIAEPQTEAGYIFYSSRTGWDVNACNTAGTRMYTNYYNGLYYPKVSLSSPDVLDTIPLIVFPANSDITFSDVIPYLWGEGAIADTSMTGQTLELRDGFNISNDQAKLIDLAGIESLVGTLGLTLDNINDLVDSIPLIIDYPWADTFPDDPAFADTPDDAIPWVDAPTAVVPAEVPEYVPETPADEGSYKVLGLERVFPFSIPFDFIAVVNLLNAEPVCPEFTFRVYNPISGQNIDATMSFERFEAVAQVIRIVETIGFIVFLILITRSLIRS